MKDYSQFLNEIKQELDYLHDGGTSYRMKTAELSLRTALQMNDITPFLNREVTKQKAMEWNYFLDLLGIVYKI